MFARHRSRIPQALGDLDEASSDFSNSWRGRSAAMKTAGSSTATGTRCAAVCLKQHSLTWDEWSSPGELIHPGDLASITSSEGELDLLRKQRLPAGELTQGSGAAHAAIPRFGHPARLGSKCARLL